MKIGIVILAAGGSKRMGQPKQLLKWKHTTLVGHVTQTAWKSQLGRVAVVVGAEADAVAHASKMAVAELGDGVVDGSDFPPLAIIKNGAFELGPGSSVQAGVKWAQSQELDGVLYMLGDQPLITSEDLRKLVAAAEGHGLVTARYIDGNGVPAFFSARYFPDLLEISAHDGAKSLLQKKSGETLSIDLGTRLIDVDTFEDYQKYSQVNL